MSFAGRLRRSNRLTAAIGRIRSAIVRTFRNGSCAMSFPFLVSFALMILAIVGVFIQLPVVSDYAFWLAVLAYGILAGARFHHHHHRD
jgi:hypothetical protein